MKHILIDFENIQPENLNKFQPETCCIWLFVGQQQHHISIPLAKSLLKCQKGVEIIQIAKVGNNALDFHLAYYLGKITERDPKAEIFILSKDTGYDPLIEYMQNEKLCTRIQREPQNVPSPKNIANSASSKMQEIKTLISGMNNKPKKTKSLTNCLVQQYKYTKSEAEQTILYFKQKSWITISETNKITYHF